jgi:DNA polymerase-3 subunit beta
MRFVISTQELNYLLSKCLNVVPLKPSVPILSNILIEAINDELIFTATDLTVGIRCFTDAKIFEEGSTTIPGRRLSQLARELTAMNLEISTNSQEVMEITADSSRFKLHGMGTHEFPALPPLNEALQLIVPQADLKEAFYRTAFAVSREDNRYVLTGVCLTFSQGIATFIATDGKRLARAQIKVNIDPTFEGRYIIPIKAVEEVQKNLREEGDVQIFLMKDKIAFQANQTMMVSKLLSGDYPDVNRVIPQTSEATVALHREELISLLRQVSLFTSEDSHSVRFTLVDGELKLSANTREIGEGHVSMPANYHGNRQEIAFDPTYFLDILRHSKSETITLAITDAYTPGVITDDKAEPSQAVTPLFVLMPMRLDAA